IATARGGTHRGNRLMKIIVVSPPFSPTNVAAENPPPRCRCEALAGLGRHEIQCGGIDAVAQARGRRTVVEHVSQMSAAPCAMDLGPGMEQPPIRFRTNGCVNDRLPEARPASFAVILGL